MKINLTVRAKNPWFWVSLIGVILTAMGVSPEMFTSWGVVITAIKDLFSNPFLLGSVIIAILGVFVDPTTAGLGDTTLVMGYKTPRNEKKEIAMDAEEDLTKSN